MSKAQIKAKPVEVGRLTYVEGDMIAAGGRSIRACWLADEEDEVVCVVTSGADFERSRRALKGAALAAQAFGDLLTVSQLVTLAPLAHGIDIPDELMQAAKAAIAKATQEARDA